MYIQSDRVNPDLRLSGQNFPTPEFFIIPVRKSFKKIHCNSEYFNPEFGLNPE
jgi:hypothetical protein